MNFLDLIIAVPLIYGAYKGFKKGLIFEVAMLAGLIAGVYLAFKFSGLVFGFLVEYLKEYEDVLHFISFLIVFGAILLIFIFYAKLLEAVLKITSLNLFNKITGMLLGIFKLALALSVILWLIKPLESTVDVLPEKVRKGSLLYPYILKTSTFITPVLQDVKKEFKDKMS